MKLSMSVSFRTYCSGCGEIMEIRHMSSPFVYNEQSLAISLDRAVKSLEKYKCPRCKNRLEHIDWFSLDNVNKPTKKAKKPSPSVKEK